MAADLRIWSVWPAEWSDPVELAQQAARTDVLLEEDLERPLPWLIPETAGQRWGDLFTGRVVRITGLVDDQVFPGNPRPGFAPESRDDMHNLGLGFWTNEGRFVAFSWVRLDHLPADNLRRWWLGVRIPYVEEQIAQLRKLLGGDVSEDVRERNALRLRVYEAGLIDAQREAARPTPAVLQSVTTPTIATPAPRTDVGALAQARLF